MKAVSPVSARPCPFFSLGWHKLGKWSSRGEGKRERERRRKTAIERGITRGKEERKTKAQEGEKTKTAIAIHAKNMERKDTVHLKPMPDTEAKEQGQWRFEILVWSAVERTMREGEEIERRWSEKRRDRESQHHQRQEQGAQRHRPFQCHIGDSPRRSRGFSFSTPIPTSLNCELEATIVPHTPPAFSAIHVGVLGRSRSRRGGHGANAGVGGFAAGGGLTSERGAYGYQLRLDGHNDDVFDDEDSEKGATQELQATQSEMGAESEEKKVRKGRQRAQTKKTRPQSEGDSWRKAMDEMTAAFWEEARERMDNFHFDPLRRFPPRTEGYGRHGSL